MPQVRRQHRISSEAADTVKINSQLRRNYQWNADINKDLACSSVSALELGQNHARRLAAIDLFNRFKSRVNIWQQWTLDSIPIKMPGLRHRSLPTWSSQEISLILSRAEAKNSHWVGRGRYRGTDRLKSAAATGLALLLWRKLHEKTLAARVNNQSNINKIIYLK